jgi:uncharacterized protein YodC (DUF2158 family)
MTIFKAGDLVVLKSGGPIMTVDTVNTDIFDDDKVTGVLCAWFVGDRLERVRFDHRAIEPARVQEPSPHHKQAGLEADATGDYKDVLDTMVDAMNISADQSADAPKHAPEVPAKKRRVRSATESRSGERGAVIV